MSGILSSAAQSAVKALNTSWGSQGLNQFKRAFQITPIILTGGIAATIPGGGLPIISLTEAQHTRGITSAITSGNPLAGLQNLAGQVISAGISDIVGDLLGGGAGDLDDYFAQFQPLPGASLIDQDIGEYPFANQAVAANAVIAKPLMVSMMMLCPVRDAGGYEQKMSIMSALRAALAQHNNSGGTYTIATPSYYYVDCVMLGMRDASGGESRQPQIRWQIDFRQPLLTLQQAQQQQSALMSKISGGVPVQGDPPSWSGGGPSLGFPGALATPSIIPAALNAAAAGVSGVVNAVSTVGGILTSGVSVSADLVVGPVGIGASATIALPSVV